MFERIKSLFQYRATWSSERAFVFATIAAAVGLGNIWRFPYIAGENGGAAFVFAYLIAVVLLGIPLMIIELAAGRMERGSPVRTFRRVFAKKGTFVGWLVITLTIIIMSYYLVVTGWTLAYAVGSVTGNIKPFSEFLLGYDSLVYFLIVCVMTGWVIARGIYFIEILSKILMPFLAIIVFTITLYSLTLDGTAEAFRFLFQPDMREFLNPAIWMLAFGQAFYSLAVGQGYLITYGSFLPEKVNLFRASTFVALVETTFAIVAGLMIFPIVFTLGTNPAEGTELAFEVLPHAFDFIVYGNVLAVLFFVLFFFAAFSSCIAGMEVIKTAFKEELKLSSVPAMLVSFAFVIPLGTLAALSFSPFQLTLFSRPFLEMLDLFAANQIVIASAVVGGGLICWLAPREQLIANMGTNIRQVSWWTITVGRYLPIAVSIVILLTVIF